LWISTTCKKVVVAECGDAAMTCLFVSVLLAACKHVANRQEVALSKRFWTPAKQLVEPLARGQLDTWKELSVLPHEGTTFHFCITNCLFVNFWFFVLQECLDLIRSFGDFPQKGQKISSDGMGSMMLVPLTALCFC